MKHYLKNNQEIGYTSYLFFDEENLISFDFSTTKSIDWSNNFCDKEELIVFLKMRLERGYYPVTRKEFNDAFIEVNKELNLIIKEI